MMESSLGTYTIWAVFNFTVVLTKSHNGMKWILKIIMSEGVALLQQLYFFNVIITTFCYKHQVTWTILQ